MTAPREAAGGPPSGGPSSFAAIPATVRRVLTGQPGGLSLGALDGRWDRVLLVLVDGLGWRGIERYADHPLLERVRAEGTLLALDTQFPSTTTAHVTTLHTGLPVGQHGLYEWHVLEPSLGRIVRPLPFAFDGDAGPDSLLAAGLDPGTLVPGPTVYDVLASAGAASTVHQPSAFSPSTFDGAACAGAELRPHAGFVAGLADAAAALREDGPRFAYVYDDKVDATGHLEGPSSEAFDTIARRRLDALLGALPSFAGALVLICADHGQDEVSPERVDRLDELWPPLLDVLDRGADGRPLGPAGSARDVFLHVRAGAVADAVGALQDALGDRGEVHATADLVAAGWFGEAGPRLHERLASVCVLPSPGRMAWLARWAGVEQVFRGHHGGRTPQEARTFLAALAP